MLNRLAIAALTLGLFAGCGGGPSTLPVTGVITLDGTPISGAVVTFQPAAGSTGQPAVGTTDAKGKFSVTDLKSESIGGGAVAGEYLVGVVWYKPDPNDSSQATGESGGSEEGAIGNDKSATQTTTGPEALLPAAYSNPKTSGLTASVKSGNKEFNYELDSKFKGEAAK